MQGEYIEGNIVDPIVLLPSISIMEMELLANSFMPAFSSGTVPRF